MEVQRGRKRSEETRYFISSLQVAPSEMLHEIRGHWGIEDGLHWILDIVFRKDESRVRKDHAAENFAVLRHIVVNLLKRNPIARRLPMQRIFGIGYDFVFSQVVKFYFIPLNQTTPSARTRN